MKKIYSLIWLAMLAFSFKASAQTTQTCNAEFGIQMISYNAVKFNPGSNTDSIQVKHHWIFGDGSAESNMVSPTYNYNLPGTYTVVHRVSRINLNGVSVCSQSFTKQISITNPTCNLEANFSAQASTTNPLSFSFQNQSQLISSSDSVSWTFGDGKTSTINSPTHVYEKPGTYTVCIRVKRNAAAGSSPCIREFCKTITITQPCNLEANFSAQASTTNPLSFSFQNQSQLISSSDSVSWNFGDGKTSTINNPTHVYEKPGTYTVCIRVKRNVPAGSSPCVREFCKTITIPQPCNLVSYFNFSSTLDNPLKVAFHNQSQPLEASDSIKWTFGDGTFSNDLNPIHNYTKPGTYTVCLRVKKNYPNTSTTACVKEFCKTITIIQPCELLVNYAVTSSTDNHLKYKFSNTSTAMNSTDSLKWTFGDGTSLVGVQSNPDIANPIHVYRSAGSYRICLVVKKNNTNSISNCVREKCTELVIINPCTIEPNFKWISNATEPRKVLFSNLTVTPTVNAVATWSFGDGSSASTWNAEHQYERPGKYYVCLKVQTGPNCIRVKCDTVIIRNLIPECNSLSRFSFERIPNDLQKYSFKANHINTAQQYTWTFGDGTGSAGPVAEHRYAKPGTYTVCLTVWNGPNCASTTCNQIQVVQQNNCDSIKVEYNYSSDPIVPNRVKFDAKSNSPILNQVWTITKIPTTSVTSSIILNQNNPTYLFQDTGTYKVCLKISTSGNCFKEFCRTINIRQIYNACVLQAYPNPVSNIVNVNINLTEPEMIHAYVYNMMNVMVREKHQPGFIGTNTVSIDVNSLTAGIYTIKFIYGNKTCTTKFQKF